MARGGRRAGRAGVNYPNRSDLQAKPRLPVTAAPGQTYGVAGAQRAAQQAVPIAAAPGPVAAPPPPPGLPPVPPGALDAPTGSPGEPLTTGSMFGPGPGPEALNPGPDRAVAALGLLNSLGGGLSPSLKHLRDTLNAQTTNQATP